MFKKCVKFFCYCYPLENERLLIIRIFRYCFNYVCYLFDKNQTLIFTKANAESLEGQVGSIAKDQEASKNEVKEVLQALEELALNYDQKLQEVDQKTKDNETLMEDLNTEQKNRQNLGHELEVLQERINVMTKKVTEITNTLLGELVCFV